MMYVLFACQLALASVLLVAATGKVLSSDQFVSAIRLSHVPEVLVIPLAVAVPTAEMCLAVALIASPAPLLPLAMVATLILFTCFTAWMIWVRTRSLRVRCGCFGTGGAEIGRSTIVRNALLIAICLIGLGLAVLVRSPLPPPSLWLLVSVGCLGMTAMLLRALQYGRAGLILTMAQRERLDRESGQKESGVATHG